MKELPGADRTREASRQQGRARRDLDTGLPPPRPIQTGERDARCGRLDEEEGGRGRSQLLVAVHPVEDGGHNGGRFERRKGPGLVGYPWLRPLGQRWWGVPAASLESGKP